MEASGKWVGAAGAAILFVLCLVLLISSLALPATGFSATNDDGVSEKVDSRPNIVVIVSDDQRWDSLWAMPRLGRTLSKHGVVFRQAFVTNTLCCPSRASILTGQYSHGTGVYTNHAPLGGVTAFDPAGSIAVRLRRSGYRTGLFGKYLNQYEGPGVPPGWDRWAAYDAGGSGTSYDGFSLDIDGTSTAFPGYSTDVLARMSERFVQDAPSPYFLYVAPSAPHMPAIPADRDLGSFDDFTTPMPPSFAESDISDKPPWLRAVRPWSSSRVENAGDVARSQLASLQALDDLVAGLVKAVKTRGELDRTMFVFLSDNGYLWGEHRLMAKEAVYDESIRVPMVVRYDPLTSAGRTDDRMVLNIDLAPTFADLANIRLPDADGVSLVPLLRSRRRPGREDFLIEHVAETNDRMPSYCAVRSRRWKYVLYQDTSQELYNLRTDPYEMDNLIGRSGARAAWSRLGTRLVELCDPPPPGFTALDLFRSP